MPDYHIAPQGETAHERAVNYVLQRIARDADFAYHLHGTQTLALCLEAEGVRTGQTRQQVEIWLDEECRQWRAWLRQHQAHEPQEVVLEREISELKDRLEEVDEQAIAERRHDIACESIDKPRPRCRDVCCGAFLREDEEAAGYCARCKKIFRSEELVPR